MSAEETKDLIEIRTIRPQDVFVEGGIDNIVKMVKSKADLGPIDISNENDREKVRSMAFKVAKTKNALENMGKEFVDQQKKYLKSIDIKRSLLWEQLDGLQKDIRKPLTDFENTEKNRIQEHQDGMESIRKLLYFENEPSVEEIESRIKFCHELEKRDFQEYNEQMRSIATGAQERLSEKLAQVIKAEEDAAELERLRAEKAQREEQKRIDDLATEKAKKMVEDLTPPPQSNAPNPLVIIEPKLTDVKSVDEHKRTANNEAVKALMTYGMITEEESKNIVKAIILGHIPRVKITY